MITANAGFHDFVSERARLVLLILRVVSLRCERLFLLFVAVRGPCLDFPRRGNQEFPCPGKPGQRAGWDSPCAVGLRSEPGLAADCPAVRRRNIGTPLCMQSALHAIEYHFECTCRMACKNSALQVRKTRQSDRLAQRAQPASDSVRLDSNIA